MRLDHLLSMEDNEPNTTVRIQVKTLKILFNFEGAATAEYGGLAQLGEHLLCKQGVKGSIRLISTRVKAQTG